MSAGCRVWAHAWAPTDAWRKGRAALWVQQLTCQRCSTVRLDTINRDGIVVARKYDYVKGYQRKGMGIMKPAERGWLRMNLLATFAPPSIPGATVDDIPERPDQPKKAASA